MLSIDQIAAAEDLPSEEVAVPQWGGSVRVKSLTAEERDDWESFVISRQDDDGDVDYKNFKAELLARTLVDEGGKPLFPDQAAGVKLLAAKSGAVVSRIFEVAQRLAGLRKQDLEELEKNSAAAPSG